MSDLTLAIKLTTSGGKIVVQEIGDIAKASKGAADGLTDVGRAGANAKGGLDQAGDSMARLKEHGHQMAVQAGVLYAAMQLIGGFNGMIKQADDWGQYAARIRTATQSAEEYAYVQQRMVSSANETYRSVNETKESFIQMSPILRDMGYQLNQSIDIVDSFSSLLVTNAARADRAAAAQAALAGSIQRGAVDADAWKTIFGTMPTVLDNLTAATGKSGAEIRQLGITGKLSITDLTNALLLSYEQNREAVAGMPTTVADAMQSFNTVWSEYIGKQNEALGVTAKMADGIVFLAENFDVLVAVAGGAAVGVMTKYTLSAAAATKATYTKTMAARTAAAQELLLAKAQVAQTQASLQQATAMTGVTGTHARLATATEAHRQAVLRLTSAQEVNAATGLRLATAGRSLLGVLGGPAGIAITAGIAAASFISFGSSASDAKTRAEELKKEARELTGAIDDLNKVQARPKLTKAKEDLATEEDAAAILEREKAVLESRQKLLENWNAVSAKAQQNRATAIKKTAEDLEDVNAALDKSANEIEKHRKKIADLESVLNGTVGTKSDLPTVENKELEKALLGVYNAQMLNATAVDAYGAALTGVDLELFKAQFIAAENLPANAAEAIKRFAEQALAAQANLSIDTYAKQLQQEIGLLDIKLAKGAAEYELQKALAQFTGADPARLQQLQAELALMQQKQALASDKDTLSNLQKENDLLKIRLAQGEAEYEIQKALAALKGQDPAVLAAIEAELRLRQDLTKQISISEEIASGAFNQTLDSMTALSSAGQQFGDAMTQAFGRVAQQIDGMTASQVSYNRQLDELAKKKKEAEKLDQGSPERAKALLDIQRTETRLSKEHFQSQIGQYAALTGAAAQMFGEQSKEREKLHKLEQAFSVIEMALAMERAAANALAAIANQGSGDPYTAFARIAAMAALMAGLGLFSGSASGNANMSADRQASQGTGTVLGDSEAKSASISNALDRIADLSLDQYSELRAINSSIKALSSGIANLAVSLVGNFGRFNEQSYSGQLGTNKPFQVGSGAASFLAAGIYAPIDKLLGGIGGSILNSVLGGISKTTKNLIDSGIAFDTQNLGEIIATGLVDAAYYNVIETTKRKLWGLSKKTSTSTEYSELDDALLAEFGRIFTHLGTSINAAVDMLGIDINKTLDNFVINLPNISFKDLSGDEIAAELEAVFSQQADLMTKYLLPQIGEYQKMGEGLYDTLIRVAQEQAIVNAQLDALGLQLGDLSAVLRIDVAQSIIELMGGVEAFRDATAEYFSAFYDEQEQFDYLSKTIKQAFADLNLPLPQTREQFRAIVDALDLTTDAGQQLFAQLMQLVPGIDQYFTGLDTQQKEFEDATQRLADALAQQLGAINDVLNSIGNDILSLQRTLPGFDNIAYITGQITELTAALSGSADLDEQLNLTNQLRDATMQRYNAELQALAEASSAAQVAYRAELQAIQALNKAAESLSKTAASMLIGDLSPLTTGQRLAEAQSQFDVALAAARGGDVDAYSLVQSLGQQILQLQKEFNPAAYTDVFGDIKAIFEELGGNVFAEPDAALHPDIVAYEDAKISLAEQTIHELQRLQEQTALLREIAQQDYQSQLQQIPVVNGAVVVDTTDVVKKMADMQKAQADAAAAAAAQRAADAAKQQQQMAEQSAQQIKIWRAINEQNELMQQMMRR